MTPKSWLPQKIGYPKKLINKKKATPQKMLPPKNDKKNGYPKKFGVLYCEGVLHFGKMAYFIAYGFVNAIQTLWTLPLILSIVLAP